MYFVFKNILDRFLAFFLFITLIIIPIIPITILVIWIEDPGDVFFFQDRIGLNGKSFKVIKFRSMYKDADQRIKKSIISGEIDRLNFKEHSQSMTTKVGKVIRKLSIDELPQLVNIIKGDMAIVGPRPLQQFEITHHILTHKEMETTLKMSKRLSVKPGLLCYWQVTPNKNDIPFSDRMNLDLLYIDNVSFKTDFLFILKGFYTVLMGNNN
ncbi:sugar transferase [Streptococcus pneumoniae]|uniref:sugar transferase n=1 Tax=Streptococcus pneumoniae TaxID=1313 RepID=UPI0005E08D12|nr:sugar transferase [Streptococcus pneumoniae]COE46509.1 glycosyl transferase CpsE [Streptococcus pneumoniae]